MNEEVSTKTKILFSILDFQIDNGHGLEMKHLIKLTGLEESIVINHYHTLINMGVIKDLWHSNSNGTKKVIEIPYNQLEFVIGIRHTIDRNPMEE